MTQSRSNANYIYTPLLVDILPKILYLILQLSAALAIIGLNWDFLTDGGTEGLIVLTLVSVLLASTLVFYMLTGCTDPGQIRTQVFENQYETTEFIEDEDAQAV